jgi:hypothetical protein
MAGLDPAIHLFRWMRGSSPRMTNVDFAKTENTSLVSDALSV